jgi:hypothetical protein
MAVAAILFEGVANGVKRIIRADWEASYGGLGGFIAIRQTDFLRLRGYDERMVGWGSDDVDFLYRAVKSGWTIGLTLPEGLESIRHSDEIRVGNTGVPGYVRDQDDSNRRIMYSPDREKTINPKGFGIATVYRNFEDKPFNAKWGDISIR